MEMLKYRIEELFDALDVKVYKQGKKYIGRCPVHGGRTYSALAFMPDGDKRVPFWQCYTHHCESTFNGSVIGFIAGCLSHSRYRWQGKGDERVSWNDAIKWACDFLGIDFDNIKVDTERISNRDFIDGIEAFSAATPVYKSLTGREQLRKRIEIPSKLYLSRGFASEILDKYDIGLCVNPKAEMYNRVVIPFYDMDNKNVVGCIGRITSPHCGNCKMFHDNSRPCFDDKVKILDYCKFRNSKNFNDKNFLYNYWFAHEEIYQKRQVILVEGCSDVWRFAEAEINNVVAINGSELTDSQKISLECSGATSILCATDNDEAGEKAYQQISDKCWFARTTRIRPTEKDFGEMDINTIRKIIYDASNYRVCRT